MVSIGHDHDHVAEHTWTLTHMRRNALVVVMLPAWHS